MPHELRDRHGPDDLSQREGADQDRLRRAPARLHEQHAGVRDRQVLPRELGQLHVWRLHGRHLLAGHARQSVRALVRQRHRALAEPRRSVHDVRRQPGGPQRHLPVRLRRGVGGVMTLWQRAKWAFTNEGGDMWASIISAGAQFGLGAMGLFSQPSGKMTTAQKAFLTKQQAQQDQAYNFQQMLKPFLLDQMGLEATFGPGGAVTSIKKRALTKEEQQAKDIQGLAQEKVLKGLRGELDIDPATERNLERESEAIIRDQVRRGQMTDAEAIASTEANRAFRETAYRGGLMAGLPGRELEMSNAAQDYPGFVGRQNYLSSLGRANRYAQLGNLIGGTAPRVIRGFTNAPAPERPEWYGMNP